MSDSVSSFFSSTTSSNNDVLALLDHIHGSVSVVGSMNADYTVAAQRLPGPGETVAGGPLQILPGGKSGNQAAAAARIGANVRIFGAVGSDSNADFLLGALDDAGVDTANVRRVAGPSGTTVIMVDAAGENAIVYSPGSNAQVTADYIEASREALTGASVLGLCLESPMEAVTAAARMCHEAGVKVLLNNSPFTPVLPAELIEAADVLLVNEHEMVQLLGIAEPENDDWSTFDWETARQRMHEYGFKQAIVTLGGDGSMVLDSACTRIAPVKVDAVDTTGCGDSFMGTVLAGLASGFALREAASLASYVSAYAATGYGAQASYGTAAQIRERFSF
ncbi:PfkB family sugar kinase [Bifidobacterium saguini DSM 23967]|uniref:Ribokinase n=3 Tax=Bifidobacterium TaxID=1678 RepID=A0A2N5ITN1_9BIFI|nr:MULTISPECIES: ribokinase [Bifidobacterium]KFI94091.1 PfkB family sugar kinase [Bifidobacterium saguini DSM 23967]PLS25310.1 sugar kinase [Bifidobacterium imperatoris]QSY57929.1 ribokinase [Bifidobacterium imperatoris]QTB90395.1 ribokinase [Bifidobacterium saguini]